MLGGIGMPELLIILVIVMIVFGAGKLPDIGKGLGQGIKNFKKATQEMSELEGKEKLEDKHSTNDKAS